MAVLYGKNYNTNGGGPGSAGDSALKVDRPNEGLTGVAMTQNAASNGYDPLVQTRGNFDTYKAIGSNLLVRAYIDTTQTNFQDLSTSVKRMKSNVW